MPRPSPSLFKDEAWNLWRVAPARYKAPDLPIQSRQSAASVQGSSRLRWGATGDAARAKALVCSYIPEGRRLSDELIKERRKETPQ